MKSSRPHVSIHPITPERITELRGVFDIARQTGGTNTSYGRLASTGDELLDEVERLRAWLQYIRDEPNHSGYTLRHYALRALEGQKVEDWNE